MVAINDLDAAYADNPRLIRFLNNAIEPQAFKRVSFLTINVIWYPLPIEAYAYYVI